MRLLTEYMSIPEANAGILPAATSANSKIRAAEKEVEGTENINLQLAKKIEEHKSQLVLALSRFPVTALWILNKYDQPVDKIDQEDDIDTPSEQKDAIRLIKNHYQALSQQALENRGNADGFYDGLTHSLQNYPFGFEDLVSLVDLLVYSFKCRGLSLYPVSFPEKKLIDIVISRLQGVFRRGELGVAEQFKVMTLAGQDEKFLLLSPNEMRALLPELVLAEYNWLKYRQQLASANSKLVLFIANQYKGSFLGFEDLVQEGHTGLLKAVDRFKYRLGFQFSTYAGYWIRQAISRALSRNERVVRIPCGQIATINKVFRVKDELTLKTGKEPTTKTLAENCQMSQDETNNILSISQSSVALESFDDADDEQTFAPIDFLEQNVYRHSLAMIAETQLQNLVQDAIKTLNPREAKIICAHFGVDTDNQQTLQEIGKEMNLTRERIRQIQAVALNKIKMRYGEQLMGFL